MEFINVNNIFSKKTQPANVSSQNNVSSGEIDQTILETVLAGNMHPETSMYYQAMAAWKNGDVNTFIAIAEAYNNRVAAIPNSAFQPIDIQASLEQLPRTRKL
jgi:hypothetical protein